MNCYKANFLALLGKVVNSLTNSLSYRTHSDNHAVGILGSVVIKETIFAASKVANLLHVVLYNGRNCGVVVVARLTMLEEHVGVLGSTACDRLVGVHSTLAEAIKGIHVNEWFEVLLVKSFNLLNLV